MPFITQDKTNWKFLLIVAALAIFAAFTVLSYAAKQQSLISELL
jgi:hypothetical protein